MDDNKQKRKKPKKPYHIKRSDLNLDEYKKEIQDRSPGHLFHSALATLRVSRQFHLYLLLQCLAAAVGYGQIMLCIGNLPPFASSHPPSRGSEHRQACCGRSWPTRAREELGRRAPTPSSTKTQRRKLAWTRLETGC